MKIAFNKSSLLAAIEISKDRRILDIKDLNYLESIKNSFDMKNGHKLIKLIGSEKIKQLSEKNKINNYQLTLREILMKYLKNEKPGFLLRITAGREYFLSFIDENFEQLLNEAGLYEDINLTTEGKQIGKWWDDISEFVRNLEEDKKIDQGREGEKKTIEYETNKLKKMNINKSPKWKSYDDNSAGYDVLSWDNEENEIFIEVKATNNSNGIFFLSKGEWRFSISAKKKIFYTCVDTE